MLDALRGGWQPRLQETCSVRIAPTATVQELRRQIVGTLEIADDFTIEAQDPAHSTLDLSRDGVTVA
jgi:tRNA U55 pseudouridine synthase TruB